MKTGVQVIFSVLCLLTWYYGLGSEVEVAFWGSLIRGIGSASQARKLQKQADAINPIRPDYEIPQEQRDVLANSQNMAQGDMPGYGRTVNQVQGNTANALNTAQNFADSGSSLLSTLGIVTEGERSNLNDVNMQNQQFKVGQMNNFNSALLGMADRKDMQFNLNEYQPWQQQEFDKRNFQEAARNQKMATWDAAGAFADGVQNTALTIASGGMAGSGGLFGSMFGKK